MRIANKYKNIIENTPYQCSFDWNDSLFLQCGDSGIVFIKKGSYKTAFFEVFLKDLNVLIRGEGELINDAENSAWIKYNSYLNCEHSFERVNGRNGFCHNCNITITDHFPPLEHCFKCNKKESNFLSYDDHYYCKKHYLEKESDIEQTTIKNKIISNDEEIFGFIITGKETYQLKINRYRIINELDQRNIKFSDLEYVENEAITKLQTNFQIYNFNLMNNINKERNVNEVYKSYSFNFEDYKVFEAIFSLFINNVEFSLISDDIKALIINNIVEN